ncbi:MAG TPA: type II toxin-antitoxin system HicA family toxin [Candidatus Paceibacterota bacterium]|nr:type II toxin-antitoxin system HicA family toxin [Candidatus Paceibacterota bacterium]
MPKLKPLSGKEVVDFCMQYGFTTGKQKGSHMNLIRNSSQETHIVTVPNHKEIDRGTLYNIFKHLKPYIPEEELRKFFYTGDN